MVVVEEDEVDTKLLLVDGIIPLDVLVVVVRVKQTRPVFVWPVATVPGNAVQLSKHEPMKRYLVLAQIMQIDVKTPFKHDAQLGARQLQAVVFG